MISIKETSSSSSPCYIGRPSATWVFFTKLVSGRFILTVVSSVAFLIIVIRLSDILVSKAEDLDNGQILLLLSNLALIIQNVFNSYFNKKRQNEEIKNDSSEF